MVEKGDKKIIRLLVLWVLLLVLGAASLYLLFAGMDAAIKQQTGELLVMHPEWKDELADGAQFYRSHNAHILFSVSGLYVTGISAVMLVYLLVSVRRAQKEKAAAALYTERLIEQLGQFQKGNFQIPVQQEEKQVADELWGKLTELAFFLQEMKEELVEEENNTKQFISDISHQLKTPLASLRMSHELLQSGDLSQENRQMFLQNEQTEIQRLELLLQELVNLSRLESHMIQICPEKSGITRTITEAVNVVILKAIAKNVEIQVNIPADIEVLHDSKWTIEAIANVLDNAVKYTKEHTSVELTVKTLPNLVLIEIKDEGIGIPQEELHRIFQRFYRGKEATKWTRDGAGIGLYLTRKILEQQGGMIVARQNPAGGMTFQMTLPL